jgi:hypothetical protein
LQQIGCCIPTAPRILSSFSNSGWLVRLYLPIISYLSHAPIYGRSQGYVPQTNGQPSASPRLLRTAPHNAAQSPSQTHNPPLLPPRQQSQQASTRCTSNPHAPLLPRLHSISRARPIQTFLLYCLRSSISLVRRLYLATNAHKGCPSWRRIQRS